MIGSTYASKQVFLSKRKFEKICSGPGSCIFGINLYCLPLKAINLSQAVGS